MTEEEYFRKNYPNSCYGDKPLSPHWDFFQDGVEFGERQYEKRIEELEKENESLENIKNIYLGDLIKAKELLKELFSELDDLSELSGMSYKTKLKEQAEQFLNSEVEK